MQRLCEANGGEDPTSISPRPVNNALTKMMHKLVQGTSRARAFARPRARPRRGTFNEKRGKGKPHHRCGLPPEISQPSAQAQATMKLTLEVQLQHRTKYRASPQCLDPPSCCEHEMPQRGHSPLTAAARKAVRQQAAACRCDELQTPCVLPGAALGPLGC